MKQQQQQQQKAQFKTILMNPHFEIRKGKNRIIIRNELTNQLAHEKLRRVGFTPSEVSKRFAFYQRVFDSFVDEKMKWLFEMFDNGMITKESLVDYIFDIFEESDSLKEWRNQVVR